MATIRLQYVVSDTDRHGNRRFYLRRKGQPKVRIPGEPGSARFMAAYHAALAASVTPKRAPVGAGSFRAACIGYYASPGGFQRLDRATQAWQRRWLDHIAQKDGEKTLAGMRPKHVRKYRDDHAATPASANNMLKAVRALFAWAIEAELAHSNPARDVKPFRLTSGGHHTWTLDEIAQFETRHPLGAKAHLAMALILYTTGRREDAVRFGRQHVKGGRIRYVQAKNEHRAPVELDIPVHSRLAAAIGAMPPTDHLTFLLTEHGRPFTPAGFGNWFRERCNEAGLPHCSAHGLRKAGATIMAEGSATPHEIMAVTGHKTLREVERYTRAAAKRGLADKGVAKIRP